MQNALQTEYLRSGGAMILTFMEEGASAVISFCIRSAMPMYCEMVKVRSLFLQHSFLRPRNEP